jgi:hypothetical protein
MIHPNQLKEGASAGSAKRWWAFSIDITSPLIPNSTRAMTWMRSKSTTNSI